MAELSKEGMLFLMKQAVTLAEIDSFIGDNNTVGNTQPLDINYGMDDYMVHLKHREAPKGKVDLKEKLPKLDKTRKDEINVATKR